ncbi:MAG: hypothetical protein H6606_06000 [Flavobacteriales bacterium]|nr:hypothetical protein [Flavobacteriales bacterium]
MNKTDLKRAREAFKEKSAWIAESTFESLIKETPAQQEQRIKDLLKVTNYGDFFNYYLGRDTPIPMADSDCAQFHISSYVSLARNRQIKQFRRWFRGAAKSVHTNVGNPMALKQIGELKFMTVVGANELRAKLLLSDLQAQFENNARYINDFGKQVSYGDWADGMFQTTDNCYFIALGIDQPFRGLRRFAERVDLAIIDDCEDREVALNSSRVQKRGEKVLGDLGEAFGKDRQRMVIANNYITKTGLLAYLLDKIGNLPTTQDSLVNFVGPDGKPTWPERYTQADVDKKRANTNYFFWERELMNNPIEEGKLFKSEWIHFVPSGFIRKWDGLLMYWDLSYKKEGDFKAAALLGFKNGRIHVLKAFCRKCDIAEAVSWHFDTVQQLSRKGKMPICFYDATAAQEEVFRPIFQAEALRRNFFEIPIPDRTARIDKHLRIEATLMNVFFNRKLVFDKSLEKTPDMDAALNQILSFEKSTKIHDDFPDVLEAGVRLGQEYFAREYFNEETAPIITQRKRGGF